MEASHIFSDIKPTDLPAPPQAAIQIMRACSKAEVDHTALTKLASSDPILTAELLRVVNSPYFGLSKEVTSIARAVTVLGQRALRNVALCVSVRDALKEDAIPGFDTSAFWEDAIRRAVSARILGSMTSVDLDDCFTAGLLQDFGLLVMFFLQPAHASRWSELRAQDPDTRYGTEIAIFNTTHEKVGRMLALTWALPEDLVESMGHHHSNKSIPDDNHDQLRKILQCSDWVAAVYNATDKGDIIDQCRKMLDDLLGLDSAQAEQVLTAIPDQANQAAEALGLRIEQQQDFDSIIREANVRLAEANLSYQELTWQLENALNERDRLQAELNNELDLAREVQSSLLPRASSVDYPVIGINLSARHLSGDFYDFFTLPDGRIYFNLGDVSGKGVHAALLMAKTISLFRCLGKRIDDPGQLLGQINNELCETSTRGMFVTVAAGLYNPKTGNVQMVNAGHLPAIMVGKDGKFGKLDAEGLPLGIIADGEYPVKSFNLSDGSLYLFSDGVTEGYLIGGEELGMRGLLNLFRSLANKPPQQRLESITAQLTNSAEALRDDATLVLVEGVKPGA